MHHVKDEVLNSLIAGCGLRRYRDNRGQEHLSLETFSDPRARAERTQQAICATGVRGLEVLELLVPEVQPTHAQWTS